jgi:hypothetical protein
LIGSAAGPDVANIKPCAQPLAVEIPEDQHFIEPRGLGWAFRPGDRRQERIIPLDLIDPGLFDFALHCHKLGCRLGDRNGYLRIDDIALPQFLGDLFRQFRCRAASGLNLADQGHLDPAHIIDLNLVAAQIRLLEHLNGNHIGGREHIGRIGISLDRCGNKLVGLAARGHVWKLGAGTSTQHRQRDCGHTTAPKTYPDRHFRNALITQSRLCRIGTRNPAATATRHANDMDRIG